VHLLIYLVINSYNNGRSISDYILCLPCVCVYVVFNAEGNVDWLQFDLWSVCYLCQFKEGVSVADLLLSNRYFCWLNTCIYGTVPPNNWCLFLYDMLLVIVVCFPLSRIHVCSLVCVQRMPMLNCWSLYILCFLCTLRLLSNLTVQHTLRYVYYISVYIFHLNYCKFVLRWAVVVLY
jgi:hypothetical protein